MSVALYFDHNMPLPLASALRERGVDVLSAREDGCDREPDEVLLERATELERVMVSQDSDFLQLAQKRLSLGRSFPGLVFCRISGISTSELINDVELIAVAMTSGEMADQVVWIPF